ncbi:MAG: hypothetical protein GEV28_18665 [Actinophytocola sp.]|uniref:BTAD domain-containing putative transcriptional regulator n=1 Tax=Actinophytocola sp. TaxID=1872138 RepID=UPI001322C427|nr:BTAD domain-containing putative transcriptional regulator [Actinophytocola sp.]MPZ82305.1 hypothetical protein [Actinophytocola sp.]
MAAALLLEANRTVSTERLVDLTWPDSPPRSARTAIHGRISRLRATLAAADGARRGVALVSEGSGYALRTDPGLVDAHRFTELLGQARAAHTDELAASLYDQALRLWRGPALDGVATGDVRREPCGSLEEGDALTPPTRARPAAPAGVPAHLPAAAAGFTGRVADVRRLIGLLADRDAAAMPVAVVCGPAGVGKSALVVHCGHQVAGRYPDGQLYVNLWLRPRGAGVAGGRARPVPRRSRRAARADPDGPGRGGPHVPVAAGRSPGPRRPRQADRRGAPPDRRADRLPRDRPPVRAGRRAGQPGRRACRRRAP